MKPLFFVIVCAVLLVPTVASAETAGGYTGYLTTGRLLAMLDGFAGLISLVLGGMSYARSAGRFGKGSGRRGANAAAAIGVIAIVYAVVHLSVFTGDFGTGSGRAGALFAIVFALAGLILAGLTLTRSRCSA
jgi:peptidoglycan/LPS O-acetylase OafA/YrhL